MISKLIDLEAEVTALDNGPPNSMQVGAVLQKVNRVRADITEPSQLAGIKGNFDYIIHLAAVAQPMHCEKDPKKAFDINVNGTYNVLKLAVKCNAKKVAFASSAHVYGISPKYVPTNEEHPLYAHDTYTVTKVMGENLCRLFYTSHNLGYIALRLFNGYGPGQSSDYFISAKIIEAEKGLITLRGSRITKDFVYVDDMVDAIVRASTSSYVGPINVGSGKQTSLNEVASYISEKKGVDLKIVDDGITVNYMQSSVDRAKEILDWSCKVNLQEGLDRTIASFATHSH
ncbi:MAG: NAD-dependent epimerase/dehydratase family protein [Thaumarchaeota archaeon]|nr:NAD-dependent epimerase/dehydratase family protein [Nitrososphaerota archaeon]